MITPLWLSKYIYRLFLDNDESVPQARKHSRTERVSGSPVRQQTSLPPPPAYESTPHRKPAGRPELDGSIVTQARPVTSSWDPVEELITRETEMRALMRSWMSCSCSEGATSHLPLLQLMTCCCRPARQSQSCMSSDRSLCQQNATFPDNPWRFDRRYCHPSHATASANQ
ncbi:uncharacterized protein LOC144532755 isoform X2 [Sander vitreus]